MVSKASIFGGIKLTSLYIIITLVFLFLANTASAIFFISYDWIFKTANVAPEDDSRIQLPVFEDKIYATKVMKDFYNVSHHYKSFVGWKSDPYEGETTRITQEGIRHTFAKGEGRPVHFFGGSTMWGTGVDDDNTIASHYAKLTDGTKVLNHGISGFNSRQELAKLINLLNQNQDIHTAIFYDGVNDVMTLCRGDIQGINTHARESQIQQLLKQESPWQNNRLWNIFFSSTYEFMLRVMQKLSVVDQADVSDALGSIPSRCNNNPELMKQIGNTLIRNWELAHYLLTGIDASFYAVLQPVAYYGTPKTDYITLHDKWREDYQFIYDYVIAEMKKKGRPWFIDLSHILDGDTPYYMDWSHINAEGNRKVAQAIAEATK